MAEDKAYNEFMVRFGSRPRLRIMLSDNKSPQQKAREQEGSASNKAHPGLLYGRRDKRMLIPRSELPRINFYDLGQIKVGEVYKDLDISIDSGTTLSMVDIGGGTIWPLFDIDDLSLDDYQILFDKIFDVPIEDWKTTYRKINYEDENKFGVSVVNGRGGILADSSTVDPENELRPENPEWEEKGLKPIDPQIEVIPTGGLARGFSTGDTTNFKITTEYDFDAPVQTLDMTKGGDVFLIPTLLYLMSEQDIGWDENYIRGILWSSWTTKSRELFLDKTLSRWFDTVPSEIPLFVGYYLPYRSTGPWMEDLAIAGQEFCQEILDWIKSKSEAKLYVQHGTATSGGASFGYEPLSNYPFAGTVPGEIVNTSFNWYFEGEVAFGVFGEYSERYKGPGLLVGVIKTPTDTYYIWTNSTFHIPYWDQLTGLKSKFDDIL